MKKLLDFGIIFLVPLIVVLIFKDKSISELSYSILLSLFCYGCYQISFNKILKYPGEHKGIMLLPYILTWYAMGMLFSLLLNLSYVVEYFVFHILLVVVTSYYSLYKKHISQKKDIIYYIPFGRAENLNKVQNVDWIRLDEPDYKADISVLVADLHSPELTKEWQHFLAEKTLQGVDVYNVRQILESLTGRIKITHLYENNLGALQPSDTYVRVKQTLDIILVLLTFPITLPIMLITAIAIKLESEGPMLFIQNRVGQKGKEFKIYKFRSMCKDSEKSGAKIATVGDMRVTRIGKFIRKTRIDELPQFFNILKGDMSLIGPRPEQKVFVEQFEKSIPFYAYRHIVKPGISGWAQVTHGYAATEDETQVKIEHDFYYIKHFSFSLDVLIFFKTIHTMITGFGAR